MHAPLASVDYVSAVEGIARNNNYTIRHLLFGSCDIPGGNPSLALHIRLRNRVNVAKKAACELIREDNVRSFSISWTDLYIDHSNSHVIISIYRYHQQASEVDSSSHHEPRGKVLLRAITFQAISAIYWHVIWDSLAPRIGNHQRAGDLYLCYRRILGIHET